MASNPESMIRMTTVREDLSRVLCSSKERIRISRALRNQSHESIRRSHQAVLDSQVVITRSDRVLEDLGRSQHPVEELPEHQVPGGPGNLIQVISGQTIRNELVVMDGKHFVDCFLSNCVLEYSGHPVVMESTHFSECSFRFTGEAALTLNFLECFGLTPGKETDFTVAPSAPAGTQRPN